MYCYIKYNCIFVSLTNIAKTMKTYQIQFMTPNGSNDDFVIVKASDEKQAEIKFQEKNPDHIILNVMEL